MKKVLVSGPLSFCGAPVPISCARAEGAVISACVLGLPISVTPDATASEGDLVERPLLKELYMDLSNRSVEKFDRPLCGYADRAAVDGENVKAAVGEQDGGAVSGPTEVITDLWMRCKQLC